MKKLSQYAKENNICYKTAWNHFKKGLIQGAYQLPSGTVVIPDIHCSNNIEYNIIYTRVNSNENKNNLNSQSERLKQYCFAKGWTINEIVQEVGSGINDNRKKLNSILEKGQATRIIVEHKDRLTRFGYNYIELLCKKFNCEIIIVNEAENDEHGIIEDFVSIITSYCAKIYGKRRSKRKTEQLIEQLNQEES